MIIDDSVDALIKNQKRCDYSYRQSYKDSCRTIFTKRRSEKRELHSWENRDIGTAVPVSSLLLFNLGVRRQE